MERVGCKSRFQIFVEPMGRIKARVSSRGGVWRKFNPILAYLQGDHSLLGHTPQPVHLCEYIQARFIVDSERLPDAGSIGSIFRSVAKAQRKPFHHEKT
jgi:hypothetical protein